ncbi:2-phospho-L-lactate guanylyltransferase [Blastococcus sp. Marseille-P5729]|uniref:2-phospho-L-lactate guanylyltransferase n=1 Tax=Blastococcus sp. Marseille-P5729 TaxID=2086582 RepID=UPI000D10261C|nr:2-phospho-L-lactate guanylyltransferase [Blastococcus sp. Marseille-P5729]
MTTPDQPRWQVILPVKRAAASKTRLAGLDRARLAVAFASDTLRAVVACPLVAGTVVVTEDEQVREIALGSGAHVIEEQHDGAPRGFARLNAAIVLGIERAGLAAEPVAALTADLPALRPDELARTLLQAGQHRRSFVPDHAGTGTAFVAALRGADLAPSFGVDSAATHQRSGAVRLELDEPGLRQDVDLPADLGSAQLLGCGPATTRLLRAALGCATMDR